jgi:AcrR family transcriptional regulator
VPTQARNEAGLKIRLEARKLLVDKGAESMTLRAIARELGITAPALYRYYPSKEDLIRHVCQDVCADLATELHALMAAAHDRTSVERFFAVCRGFRGWALRHPKEFGLVFGTPVTNPSAQFVASEPFGQVFLTAALSVMADHAIQAPADETVPAELRANLALWRAEFDKLTQGMGVVFPAENFRDGVLLVMINAWIRIYGHVALEVFNRLPGLPIDTDALFEVLVGDLSSLLTPQ